MKQIDELTISDCNSFTSLPFSILPTTLKRIEISHCRKLKSVVPVSEMISSSYCNMFLDKLRLADCDSVDDISPELVLSARYLSLGRCRNLTRFLIRTGTERLEIWSCENVEILSVACGTQMTSLEICSCKKMKRLPERMQELLPSLETMYLFDCPEIESFPEGGLPFNLQVLVISGCEKLVKTLSSQVLKSLTSLESLIIDDSPQIRSLLEEGGLPSCLSELRLSELRSLPTQGLRNLTSLRSLEIYSFNQLQSLAELMLPSSLSKLTIWFCRNLRSLPVKGMPSSLSTLTILYCPLLKPLVEFEKGEYWPNIAHITIRIDDEYL